MSKAEYIILQLNVKNAKKIALLLVLLSICYHGLINADSCQWLLQKGRYKGGGANGAEWQPFGCMIHDYSET
jgi:N-acetylneuraminate 9-O-acetyltransferase